MLSATPPATPSGGLDRLDRIACLYLILPSFLFCLWFIPLVGLPLLALTGFASWQVLRGRTTGPSFPSPRWIIGIFVFALLWVAIAGVGHFFYANADWIVRDAVLHDLSHSDWPPTYSPFNGGSLILRAPVGYFLPAAAIGKLFNLSIANYALYSWTVLGWWLFLVLAITRFRTPTQRYICVAVLTLFGGLDYLGYIWANRHPPEIYEHIEWWMPSLQYSSSTTLLAWVPNHALPAWIGTLLILKHWKQRDLAKITPLLATAIPLWSPLAAIGLFPFFLFGLAWRRDIDLLFNLRTAIPFAPLLAIISTYLDMDAANVPHGWLAGMFSSPAAFIYCYTLFCLLEFGILSLITYRLIKATTPFHVAICVLCLLPLFYFGAANDLVMRASIPALTVIAINTIEPLTSTKRTFWHYALIIVMAFGFWGAIREPTRALLFPRWQQSNAPLPEAISAQWQGNAPAFPPHYFARLDANWLNTILRRQTAMRVATKNRNDK